ncbi:hypothetical protein CHS0354_009476 [Potamilus streckersoni]|uniref:Uncharacterized protein n=1 Tax=Potamilus streckersoni TaxID=2493646 RepID=A0AAE0RVQ4_9BIVA|nr:hypothetical protein CHS0354_009476 [Potamilus streckersoni]
MQAACMIRPPDILAKNQQNAKGSLMLMTMILTWVTGNELLQNPAFVRSGPKTLALWKETKKIKYYKEEDMLGLYAKSVFLGSLVGDVFESHTLEIKMSRNSRYFY